MSPPTPDTVKGGSALVADRASIVLGPDLDPDHHRARAHVERVTSLRTYRASDAIPTPDRLSEWLRDLGRVDPLTCLPNRAQFIDRLGGAMARATRNSEDVGILLINVDHFRHVNAAYGYRVADRVLQEVARRLKLEARDTDTVARLGGDEFAVILEGMTDRDGAAVASQRVLLALAHPLQFDGVPIAVTATAGVAFYPSDADSIDGLLQNADAALQHAREYNRSTCQFYSAGIGAQALRDDARRAKIVKGLASLTPREREVKRILIAGNANKVIAYMLGTSTRTVENHRASIMEKMGARSLPELVRMVIETQGIESSDAADGDGCAPYP